jgi:hypothetical protein
LTKKPPRKGQAVQGKLGKQMLIILGLICGVSFGGYTAHRRKGRWPDILHYATSYGIMFMLAGLVLTLIIHRTAT